MLIDQYYRTSHASIVYFRRIYPLYLIAPVRLLQDAAAASDAKAEDCASQRLETNVALQVGNTSTIFFQPDLAKFIAQGTGSFILQKMESRCRIQASPSCHDRLLSYVLYTVKCSVGTQPEMMLIACKQVETYLPASSCHV